MPIQTTTKECHYGRMPVFDIGNAMVYAGRLFTLLSFRDWDCLLPLSDGYSMEKPEPPLRWNGKAKELFPERVFRVKSIPTIQIGWPDGGVPDLDESWWLAVLEGLRTKVKGKVGIGCYGGHGRTGTALSCLIGLTDLLDWDDDPVEWVREHYCSEAVETKAQIDYIEKITGLVVKAKPSFQGYGGSQYNFGYSGSSLLTPSPTITPLAKKEEEKYCYTKELCEELNPEWRCETCPFLQEPSAATKFATGQGPLPGHTKPCCGKPKGYECPDCPLFWEEHEVNAQLDGKLPGWDNVGDDKE